MPDISILLNESEQQGFVRIILDAAARHLGVDGTDIVKHFKDKVAQAQQEAAQAEQIAAKNAELNAANVA